MLQDAAERIDPDDDLPSCDAVLKGRADGVLDEDISCGSTTLGGDTDPDESDDLENARVGYAMLFGPDGCICEELGVFHPDPVNPDLSDIVPRVSDSPRRSTPTTGNRQRDSPETMSMWHDKLDAGYALKDSEATKRMLIAPVVLMRIDREWNRERLKGAISKALGGTCGENELCCNVFVGYRYTEPVGLACALPGANGSAASLLQALKNANEIQNFASEIFISEPADSETMRVFCKERRVKGAPAPVAPSVTEARTAKQCSSFTIAFDTNLLRTRIEQYGGIRGISIATVDFEFAVVQAGSAPLPLEFGLCSEHDGKHFFVHPGAVPIAYESTAQLLSSCLTPHGGHGIPYRDCSFLNRHYFSLSQLLHEELVSPPDPHRIVLFKGDSAVDFDAARWIFAADCETAGIVSNIPYFEMFSLKTFATVLGFADDVLNAAVKEGSSVMCHRCWYHEWIDERKVSELAGSHCAYEDAARVHWVATQLLHRAIGRQVM